MKLSSSQQQWIEQKSQSVGFLESRFMPLQLDPNYTDYHNWISENHHQPLEYLAKNKHLRENPAKLGENLRSAFIFLHPYPREFESKWIARYAWGKDYHSTLKTKLYQLSESFETEFGLDFEQRVCVDTAPVLERSLAQQAGLGWIAKNGCLIHRQHGSFFMIACWLTSFESDSKPTVSSFHCGKCTRCIDACPTDAFLKPGFIETQKCLSTQTIENRNFIPSEFIAQLDHQVFGCDICQEVCPWNRKQLYFAEKEHLPNMQTLLSLPEKDFRDYFRNTACDRPGWVGLRRNFLIAAVHEPDISDQIFIDHLKHTKQMIRQTAQDCLNFRKSSC
jgi:epoxyqueuosine reductase